MKKIFALILCAMLICATPVIAFAEGEEIPTEVTENTTTEEIVTESENSVSEPTVPDKIVTFFKENFEGTSFASLAVTIIGYIFYEVKKNRKLDGTMGVLNNNAVTAVKESRNAVENAMEQASNIAENSGVIVQNVLAETAAIAEMVKGYRDEMVAFLGEIRKNAEEKQSLEDMLHSVEKTIETSKMANMELANEVAELLVLANIPPSKKEELYARHRTAVDAIATAEKTEVVTNDGKET
jgi:hypothetical protein